MLNEYINSFTIHQKVMMNSCLTAMISLHVGCNKNAEKTNYVSLAMISTSVNKLANFLICFVVFIFQIIYIRRLIDKFYKNELKR